MGNYKNVCYYEPGHAYMYTDYTWRPILLTGGYTTLPYTPFTVSSIHLHGQIVGGNVDQISVLGYGLQTLRGHEAGLGRNRIQCFQ